MSVQIQFHSYRDTFVIFHGYLEKYCGFKLEKMLLTTFPAN